MVVAVFQFGWGTDVLGFTSNHSVAPWLPLFLFVILFGLSMDYHVFILSRIREAYDRGMSTEDAIAHGIKTTAGTVTSAAIVMVGVFSIFATLPILDMKEMGIGLATRRADRRDDRPRRPAPGEHEAAGRLELVPAQLAALAAQARAPRRADGPARTGRRLTTSANRKIGIRAAPCGPDFVVREGRN